MAANAPEGVRRYQLRNESREVDAKDRQIVIGKLDFILHPDKPHLQRDLLHYQKWLIDLRDRLHNVDISKCKELLITSIRKIQTIVVTTGPDTKLYCPPRNKDLKEQTFEASITYLDCDERTRAVLNKKDERTRADSDPMLGTRDPGIFNESLALAHEKSRTTGGSSSGHQIGPLERGDSCASMFSRASSVGGTERAYSATSSRMDSIRENSVTCSILSTEEDGSRATVAPMSERDLQSTRRNVLEQDSSSVALGALSSRAEPTTKRRKIDSSKRKELFDAVNDNHTSANNNSGKEYILHLRTWRADSVSIVTRDEKLFLFSAKKSKDKEAKILYHTGFTLDHFEKVFQDEETISALTLLTAQAREAYLLLWQLSLLDLEPWTLRMLPGADGERYGLTRLVERFADKSSDIPTTLQSVASSILKKWKVVINKAVSTGPSKTGSSTPKSQSAPAGDAAFAKPKLPTLAPDRTSILLEKALFEWVSVNSQKRERDFNRVADLLFRKLSISQPFRQKCLQEKTSKHDVVEAITATLMNMDLKRKDDVNFRGSTVYVHDIYDEDQTDSEEDVGVALSQRNRSRKTASPFSSSESEGEADSRRSEQKSTARKASTSMKKSSSRKNVSASKSSASSRHNLSRGPTHGIESTGLKADAYALVDVGRGDDVALTLGEGNDGKGQQGGQRRLRSRASSRCEEEDSTLPSTLPSTFPRTADSRVGKLLSG